RMTKLTTSASTGRLMKRSVKDFMLRAVAASLSGRVHDHRTASDRRCYMSILSGERTRLACWRWRPRHRELFFSGPVHSGVFRRGRRNQHARARALPRSEDERSLVDLASRIHRLRIHFRFWSQIVIDHDRLSIAQFEDASSHHRFARFQSRRDRHEISARFAYAHELLADRL
ncbi:MAG: hypothetical protein QOI22_1072, partial [Verrucomicrobiota bacterium]